MAYSDNVFINCPFDSNYSLFLRGIIFTIYRTGFYPRCAMEEDNGLQNRLHKILKIIEDCKYGFHDISRTQPNPNGYPRFNMPFELGLFYACMHYGEERHKKKNAAIFEEVKYSYQQSISDLNGVDTKDHNNDIEVLITKLRNWLSTASQRRNIPGPDIIKQSFSSFELQYPIIVHKLGFQIDNVQFNDLSTIIEDWLKVNLSIA